MTRHTIYADRYEDPEKDCRILIEVTIESELLTEEIKARRLSAGEIATLMQKAMKEIKLAIAAAKPQENEGESTEG